MRIEKQVYSLIRHILKYFEEIIQLYLLDIHFLRHEEVLYVQEVLSIFIG